MKQANMFLKHSLFRDRVSGRVLDELFALHFPKIETVLDVTYGLGTFWRGWTREIPFHVHVTDISKEKVDGAVANSINEPALFPLSRMDARDLQMADNIYDVGVLDPPFLARYSYPSHPHSLEKKYGTLKSQPEILALYRDAIKELVRVCRVGMIIKLKDGISNRSLWPVRHTVTSYGAQATGRYPEDVAVFAPKHNVLIGGNWQNQRHLRRVESYFLLWRFGKGVKWGSMPEWSAS